MCVLIVIEEDSEVDDLVEILQETLPPILWRSRWNEYRLQYGLPFAYGTLANRDSQGRGPRSGRAAGRVFYRKEDFLSWLAKQA